MQLDQVFHLPALAVDPTQREGTNRVFLDDRQGDRQRSSANDNGYRYARRVLCGSRLSKTSWVCAFAVPGESKVAIHKVKARDTDRLLAVLTGSKAKAEQQLGRPLQIALCYEVGYDGFWLARYLIARAIHTIVFDPASFLMPRRSRVAKTDRLDARRV